MTNIENLVIHPDRFEDMAMAITNNLLLWKLIPDTNEDYDRSVSMIMRTFQHQLFLHQSWDDEYEGRATKFRADRTDAEEAAARATDG
jgi:hypothetical protein